jgi:hypothetical protein
MGLSFTIASGLHRRSYSQARLPQDSWPLLMSQIRDSLNLEGQVPVFTSHRNRVAQLYPPDLSLSFILRPTVSLGIKHPSGAYDQNFITVTQLRVCWCGALSLTRGWVCRLRAAGPRQRNEFRVRVLRDSWPYFTVSHSRLPFPSPPTTRRATVEVFDPATTQSLHKNGYTYGSIHPLPHMSSWRSA